MVSGTATTSWFASFVVNATGSNGTGNGSVGQDSACTLFYDHDGVMRSHVISLYGTVFFVAVGLVGNTMNMLVFSRREMRSSSSNIYLLLLATSDSLYLISVCFSKVLHTLHCLYHRKTAIDVYNRHNSVCKLVQFLMDLTADYSSCLILLFTLERLIAVYAPAKFKQICTAQRAKVVCLLLLFVTTIIIGPYHFLYMQVQTTRDGVSYCAIAYEYEAIFSTTYVIEMTLFRIIPTVVTAAFNISIIYKVLQLKQKREKWGSKNRNKPQKRDDRSMQLTIMLITVSSTYIILFLPVLTFFLIHKLWRESTVIHDLIPADPLFIFRNYAQMLYVAGHAINVFLYTVTGQVFRQQLLRILCCHGSRHHGNAKLIEMQKLPQNTEQTAL